MLNSLSTSLLAVAAYIVAVAVAMLAAPSFVIAQLNTLNSFLSGSQIERFPREGAVYLRVVGTTLLPLAYYYAANRHSAVFARATVVGRCGTFALMSALGACRRRAAPRVLCDRQKCTAIACGEVNLAPKSPA